MFLNSWRRAGQRLGLARSQGPAKPRAWQSYRPRLEAFEDRVLLALLVVTNTNDAGPGSLRQAILDANVTIPVRWNTIEFNIGNAGVQTIAPSSALPTITYPVYLDGTTQPGFSGSPLIVLSGSNAGPGANGLALAGDASVVMGLVVNGFQGNGIWLQNSFRNRIEGNYLGTDAAGTAAIGNQTGILVVGSDNTIGGTAAGTRNLISGNTVAGIDVGTISLGNAIRGNLIGTDITGTKALGNRVGVFLEWGGNSIGGTAAGAGNIISGNTDAGIRSPAGGQRVQGNDIGTDITGKAPLPNSIGVALNGSNSVVGGTAAGAGNVISGNTNYGVLLESDGASMVQGNFIGTDRSSTVALRNAVGVYLSGAGGETIGGTTPSARNVISGNYEGIVVFSSSGNLVQGNYIGTDSTGMAMLGNFKAVDILSGSGNTIGGAKAGSGNLISGNPGGGVAVFANGNVVQGNLIGTDSTGRVAMPNSYGVYISASNVTVGGNMSGAGNLISGNVDAGVAIFGSNSTGNLLQGNAIGTGLTGQTALGNGIGVSISGSNNTIGGILSGAGNLISGNSVAGIRIRATDFLNSASGNCVEGNFIGTNRAGTAAIANGDGISLFPGALNSKIGEPGAGNLISGNTVNGVAILTNQTLVRGNAIGTDVTGTAALGNGGGIEMFTAYNNTIGGTQVGERNVISGNQTVGVLLGGSSGANQVVGNYIGTDVTGAAALGNGFGIAATNSGGNTVGGTMPGAGNVISGNRLDGIEETNSNSDTIQGNYIGTDATGTAALGNGGHGVHIQGTVASAYQIGGTTPEAGNVISSNAGDGIVLIANGCRIEGNLIGTDVTGTVPLGNRGNGISLAGLGDRIGGTTVDAGNLISSNRGAGIMLLNSAQRANILQGNLIGTDASGTKAFGNRVGVLAAPQATQTTIGGTAVGAGNLISGNLAGGIVLTGAGIVVQANRIGTDISGTAALSNGTGVSISGSDNTIGGTAAGAGNLISGNDTGVAISGAGAVRNVVLGNLIGTDINGTQVLGNATGVALDAAANNTIGGTNLAASNIVSGNTNGIVLDNGASGNQVEGNYIGTDTNGTARLGNLASGIVLQSVSNNTIGGTASGAGNVISGNGIGVVMSNTLSGNSLQGNLVGTDFSGTASLGNGTGVVIGAGGTNNTIGGTTSGAGNFISGNVHDAIAITGATASFNRIQGNSIGTTVTGAALGNGGNGVYVNGSDNAIGGTLTGAGNIIAFNGNDGVLVDGGARDAILRNSIFSNMHLGIELINDGNDNQPAPVLLSAISDGSTLTFAGSLFSAPSTPYTLEFFANSADNASGSSQGERFLGSFTVITDASGMARFMATFVTDVPRGQFLTATATDPGNNTSEFSQPARVVGPGGPGGSAITPRWVPIPDALFTRNWDNSSPHSRLPAIAYPLSERDLDLLFGVPGKACGHSIRSSHHGQVGSTYLGFLDEIDGNLLLARAHLARLDE